MHLGKRAILIAAVAAAFASWTGRGPASEPAIVRIGMLSSMFRNVKPAMINALSKPLYSLIESQTGLKSELVVVPSPDEMRERMDSGTIQLGVFHGFEFAWMQQKQPNLRPLMIAAPMHRPLRACVVVNCTCDAKCLADLKGKTLALPDGTREHSRLYAERYCLKEGRPLLEFFNQVTNPKSPEDALHEVADNKAVQAAVVDHFAVQAFQGLYPGRFKKLKVIASSEAFPESVVTYREGKTDPDVVQRFRDGMANAHATPLGRHLMSLLAMSGFQPIPPQYPQQLAEIAKAYPPPGAGK